MYCIYKNIYPPLVVTLSLSNTVMSIKRKRGQDVCYNMKHKCTCYALSLSNT